MIWPLLSACGGGIFMGILAKVLDLFTANAANLFSEIPVWVLLGSWIAIRSRTHILAALRVFSFSMAMLGAYYAAAEIAGEHYTESVMIGWTVFAFLTPAAAIAVRMSGLSRKALYAVMICTAGFNMISAAVIAGRIHLSDYVLTLLTMRLLVKNRNTVCRSEEYSERL